MSKNYDKMKNLVEENHLFKDIDVLQLVQETRNIELNKEYSDSIIINFRKNLEKKSFHNEKFSFKHIITFIVFISAGYMLTSEVIKDRTKDLESTLKDINQEEISSIVDDYDLSYTIQENIPDESNHIIDSLYSEHFSRTVNKALEEGNSNEMVGDYDLYDIEYLLSDEDINNLYSQLIEKEIIRR